MLCSPRSHSMSEFGKLIYESPKFLATYPFLVNCFDLLLSVKVFFFLNQIAVKEAKSHDLISNQSNCRDVLSDCIHAVMKANLVC